MSLVWPVALHGLDSCRGFITGSVFVKIRHKHKIDVDFWKRSLQGGAASKEVILHGFLFWCAVGGRDSSGSAHIQFAALCISPLTYSFLQCWHYAHLLVACVQGM